MVFSRKEKDKDDVISEFRPGDHVFGTQNSPWSNLKMESQRLRMCSKTFWKQKKNDGELLQEFISRFTSEDSKLQYSDPIKRQKVSTFEMTQQQDTNLSMNEDEKESLGSVLSILCITTRQLCFKALDFAWLMIWEY